jgi:DNA-binding XRE family transcriptional regulator
MVRHESKTMMATMENRRLAAARVLAGLTQRELARLVGSREIEISRIETGRIRPCRETKRRIAEALGKPTFEIFDC